MFICILIIIFVAPLLSRRGPPTETKADLGAHLASPSGRVVIKMVDLIKSIFSTALPEGEERGILLPVSYALLLVGVLPNFGFQAIG